MIDLCTHSLKKKQLKRRTNLPFCSLTTRPSLIYRGHRLHFTSTAKDIKSATAKSASSIFVPHKIDRVAKVHDRKRKHRWWIMKCLFTRLSVLHQGFGERAFRDDLPPPASLMLPHRKVRMLGCLLLEVPP